LVKVNLCYYTSYDEFAMSKGSFEITAQANIGNGIIAGVGSTAVGEFLPIVPYSPGTNILLTVKKTNATGELRLGGAQFELYCYTGDTRENAELMQVFFRRVSERPWLTPIQHTNVYFIAHSQEMIDWAAELGSPLMNAAETSADGWFDLDNIRGPMDASDPVERYFLQEVAAPDGYALPQGEAARIYFDIIYSNDSPLVVLRDADCSCAEAANCAPSINCACGCDCQAIEGSEFEAAWTQINVKNDLTEVAMKKVDTDTGAALAGGRFWVCEEGTELPLSFRSEGNGVYILDENGTVTELESRWDGYVYVRGLSSGRYFFWEKVAPGGYQLLPGDDAKLSFTVSGSGQLVGTGTSGTRPTELTPTRTNFGYAPGELYTFQAPNLGSGGFTLRPSNSANELIFAFCVEAMNIGRNGYTAGGVYGAQTRDNTLQALAAAIAHDSAAGLSWNAYTLLFGLERTPRSSSTQNSERSNMMNVFIWAYEASMRDSAVVLNRPATNWTGNVNSSGFAQGRAWNGAGLSTVDINMFNSQHTGLTNTLPQLTSNYMNWSEYFHVLDILENMLEQHNAGKTTSLELTYIPDAVDSAKGTLTFAHDGYVPTSRLGYVTNDGRTIPRITQMNASTGTSYDSNFEAYDTRLSWEPRAGLTVTVNSVDYTTPTTGGVPVKKNAVIEVTYTGTEQSEIVFTLIDNQHYLKAGTVEGVHLNSPGRTQQSVVTGYAEFVRLESTANMEGTPLGEVVFGNRKSGTVARLKKVDAVTNAPVAGARFQVYKAEGEVLLRFNMQSNTYVYNPSGSETELVSGANGYVYIEGLPEGNYYFKEIAAPNGYLTPSGADAETLFSINAQGQMVVTVVSEEAPPMNAGQSWFNEREYGYRENATYTVGANEPGKGLILTSPGNPTIYGRATDPNTGKMPTAGMTVGGVYGSENRDGTLSALAQALSRRETGLNGAGLKVFLGINTGVNLDGTGTSGTTRDTRVNYLAPFIWLYEAQRTNVRDNTGLVLDMRRPGQTLTLPVASSEYGANAWKTQNGVNYGLPDSYTYSIGQPIAAAQNNLSATASGSTSMNWVEYFHMLTVMEAMVEQHNAGKTTSINFSATPGAARTFDLTYDHDGYVPTRAPGHVSENGTVLPQVTGLYNANPGGDTQAYDPFLTWSHVWYQTLDVYINGSLTAFDDYGAYGFRVTKNQPIRIFYRGAEQIRMTITDRQHYLVAGSLKGEYLNPSDPNMQGILTAHAEFTTLQSHFYFFGQVVPEIVVENTKKDVPDKEIVTMRKVDDKTGEPLAGAEFSVYMKGSDTLLYFTEVAGVYVYDQHFAGDVSTVVSDSNGYVYIKGLPAGTYYFKETKAPDGYILPTGEDAKQEFVVGDDGKLIGGQTSSSTIPAPTREYEFAIGDVYKAGNIYNNGEHAFLATRFSGSGTLGIVALCAELGVPALANQSMTITASRDNELSALAVALSHFNAGGLDGNQVKFLLGLENSKDFDADQGNIRSGYMQPYSWLYELSKRYPTPGLNLRVPGARYWYIPNVETDLDFNQEAWKGQYGIPSSYPGFDGFLLGSWLLANQYPPIYDNALPALTRPRFSNWSEYFHMLSVLENMLEQHNRGVTTSLALRYTGTGEGMGTLTFSHKGYVTTSPERYVTLAGEKPFARVGSPGVGIYDNNMQVYDTKLTWPNTAGLTVYKNGTPFTDGATGINVKKSDAITVEYAGTDEIEFTLTDSQHYLKAGTVKGAYLETSPALDLGAHYLQDTVTGYAEFVQLQSTVSINGSGEAELILENTKGTVPDKEIVTMKKVDAETGEPLAGAEFSVYMKGSDTLLYFTLVGGVYVYDQHSAGDVSTVVSNASGSVFIKGLPAGAYYFKETKAPDGYLLPTGEDAKLDFVVGTDGKLVGGSTSLSSTIPAPTLTYNYTLGGVYKAGNIEPPGSHPYSNGNHAYTAGGLIALCAEIGVQALASQDMTATQSRDGELSALAVALAHVNSGGLTGQQVKILLGLENSKDFDANRGAIRSGYMQPYTWLYELSKRYPSPGLDLWVPGSSYALNHFNNGAWKTQNGVNYGVPNSYPGINGMYLGLYMGQNQSSSSALPNYNANATIYRLPNWSEYFHMLSILESMLEQHNNGKTTSLALTYTSTGADTGTLTFAHDGYVTTSMDRYETLAGEKPFPRVGTADNYMYDSNMQVYRTKLTWPTTAGLTVYKNGESFTNGVTGIDVRKSDTITVTYAGSDEIEFTLTDSQHYLKAGTVRGAFLNTPSQGGYNNLQNMVTGHAEFVQLQSTTSINGSGEAELIFENTKGTEPGDYPLALLKVDSETDEPLAGAQFQIWVDSDSAGAPLKFTLVDGVYVYDETGALPGAVTNLISGSTGYIYFKGLPPGDYYFKETLAPSGYDLPEGEDAKAYFTINSQRTYSDTYEGGSLGEGDSFDWGIVPESGQVSVQAMWFSNTKTDDVVMRMRKTDRANGDRLSGAQFEIWAESGSAALRFNKVDGVYVYSATGAVTMLETDAEGMVYFKGLAAGAYYFWEKVAPNGYVLPEGEAAKSKFTVDATGVVTPGLPGSNLMLGISNEKPVPIRLLKKDAESGEALPGAKFVVRERNEPGEPRVKFTLAADGVYDYDTSGTVEVLVTDADGYIRIRYLPEAPAFVFEEIEAPTGYILPEDPEDRRMGFWIYNGEMYTATEKYGTMEVVFTNNKDLSGPVLPDTGGLGIVVSSMAIGSTVMVSAVILLLNIKKRYTEADYVMDMEEAGKE